MPAEDVEYLEETCSGFIVARLAVGTGRIYGRLRKRYAVPFEGPPPEIVIGWLVAIVQAEAYLKRGINPASDEHFKSIDEERTRAFEEMKEAADAEVGLFDIPLRENTTDDGVTLGGPLGYSEASPYDWTDVQAEAVRGR